MACSLQWSLILVRFSSVQDGIHTHGNSCIMWSATSWHVKSFPSIASSEEGCLVLPLSMPVFSRWSGCDGLGFVFPGSVSSFSTLQVVREASHLRGLHFPPVYLLGHFLSHRHRIALLLKPNRLTAVYPMGAHAWRTDTCRAKSSKRMLLDRSLAAADDDEVMLNVLRCQLTY